MEVTFLSCEQPLTKHFERDAQGRMIKHSWPFVYNVTSETFSLNTLSDLTPLLKSQAAAGNCLLKGTVQRPLNKESRAGSTDANAKTDWILLDLDDVKGFDSIDAFLHAIGCGGIDYVLQWSASHDMEQGAGFRAHIYMQLQASYHPQLLKFWLMDINLSTPSLAEQLTLTRSHNALTWPLDITTCQSDKLIYLAPPVCGGGVEDPLAEDERIQFVEKQHRQLSITRTIPNKDALRERSDQVIRSLREQQGLPDKKETKYKRAGTTEYMANPDTAVITDMKQERGFMYFNLNGGDSWGYFHPEDNPMYIYNFKGEPTYRTEDLLPEYWAGIVERVHNHQPDTHGVIYLAFRDFTTANYFNGIYNTETGKLTMAQAKNETQLRHFMKQHGQPMGEYIPDWDLVFDPHATMTVDTDNHTVNTFQPSVYHSEYQDIEPRTTPPPTVQRVVNHVMGEEQDAIDHFWNWFAWITQNLDRTETAWLLQGVEGTGKGMLYHHIMAPILGTWNTTTKRMEELAENFTGFMENKFLVFMDEVEKTSSSQQQAIAAKLRNLITEPEVSIRRMYAPPYMARNYANLIFGSNSIDQIYISQTDRRFNVAPYQSEPLVITEEEVNNLPDELPALFAYLWNYPADREQARRALHNDAKDTLIELNLTGPDTLAQVINNGNMPELVSYLPSTPPSMASAPSDYMLYEEFYGLLKELFTTGRNILTREDIMLIFRYCLGSVPTSPNKFTAYAKHYNIFFTPVWNGKSTVRGTKVDWICPEDWFEATKSLFEEQ